MKNYYEILGVDETSGRKEIQKKFHELALRYHPDKNPEDKEAENKFKAISDAYSILGDVERRKEFDTKLKEYRRWVHQEKLHRQEDMQRNQPKANNSVFSFQAFMWLILITLFIIYPFLDLSTETR